MALAHERRLVPERLRPTIIITSLFEDRAGVAVGVGSGLSWDTSLRSKAEQFERLRWGLCDSDPVIRRVPHGVLGRMLATWNFDSPIARPLFRSSV